MPGLPPVAPGGAQVHADASWSSRLCSWPPSAQSPSGRPVRAHRFGPTGRPDRTTGTRVQPPEAVEPCTEHLVGRISWATSGCLISGPRGASRAGPRCPCSSSHSGPSTEGCNSLGSTPTTPRAQRGPSSIRCTLLTRRCPTPTEALLFTTTSSACRPRCSSRPPGRSSAATSANSKLTPCEPRQRGLQCVGRRRTPPPSSVAKRGRTAGPPDIGGPLRLVRVARCR